MEVALAKSVVNVKRFALELDLPNATPGAVFHRCVFKHFQRKCVDVGLWNSCKKGLELELAA